MKGEDKTRVDVYVTSSFMVTSHVFSFVLALYQFVLRKINARQNFKCLEFICGFSVCVFWLFFEVNLSTNLLELEEKLCVCSCFSWNTSAHIRHISVLFHFYAILLFVST